MAERTADDVMLRKKPEVTELGKLYGDDIPMKKEHLQLVKAGSTEKKGVTVRPYIGFRDLNGGQDGDPATRRPKPAVEVGIKISF